MPWRDPLVLSTAVGGACGLITLIVDRLFARRRAPVQDAIERGRPSSSVTSSDLEGIVRELATLNATTLRLESGLANLIAVAGDSNTTLHDIKHTGGNQAQTVRHIHGHTKTIALAKGADPHHGD